MDPLSIALAVALAFAVFAFGVLVGSLVSSYRFRKKAALASMQNAMHAPAAAVRPSGTGPEAPSSEAGPEVAPQARQEAPAPQAGFAAPLPEAGAESPLAESGFELPQAASASEAPGPASLPTIPAVELGGPAPTPAAAVTGDGLESLLAEVAAASGEAETTAEPILETPFDEEPAAVAEPIGGLPDVAVPEVIWDLPSELAAEPLPALEEVAEAEPAPLGDLAWDLPSETPSAIEESAPAASEADLSWDLAPEAMGAFEPAPVAEPVTEAGPAPLGDLNWTLAPEIAPEIAPGIDESDVAAEPGFEALPEPEVVWQLEPEAEAESGPAGAVASEHVAEGAPVSEFAWELPSEAAEEGSEAAPDAEQGLTWVLEPETELPPLFEAPAEPAAEEAEIEPSWLVEAAAGAGDEPELPTVVEPASVQGPVPEPDFTWQSPEGEVDFAAGVGLVAAAASEPLIIPGMPEAAEIPESPEPTADAGASARPRAHVVAIPEATAEGAPESAPAPREAPPMPHAGPESIDMVAPVQMWFGDYAVAVKAGSKTHAQFRKYADVLLAELRDAGERKR